jgi:hypothetical protein
MSLVVEGLFADHDADGANKTKKQQSPNCAA